MNRLGLKAPLNVLGTGLTPTTYQELSAALEEQSPAGKPIGLSFANTHIAALRRHCQTFRKITESVDYFLPDGMPLIWCLNWQGARMSDRVYGPRFMRYVMEHGNPERTHYLLGGSAACGELLRERAKAIWPNFKIVGSYHGACSEAGILEDDGSVFEQLRTLRPDYIWIGMGPTKQYVWMERAKEQLEKGVLLSVGCAFDMNAGLQKDAPGWMQKRGLTWLFRLIHEPRRLLARYLRFNALFLYYLIVDGLREPGGGAH